ncbi:AI-2E family transporter [Candidatus Poribacteria bacterium]|nr:AI-2E family transporter [Candidatus Poribacteria bacterium]MYH80137.1 AI-2E family transporter [Candidatus Poribacteria bacterium]MYK94537.1 AI-2E family transporter [Candidatus Poribacteria bacterium]
MNTQNEPNPQKPVLNGATILAIISVVLAAVWIAFAYYKGNSSNGSRTMLLHPVVPILLIVLLTRIYRWIDIKSIVILEIIMISVWVFIRLLGVLMPFILGFGFAYVFRFLWNALPFKKQYQRGIATTVIVLVCGGVLFYTGKQVSRQASQMGVGLLKFYHETVLPHAIGETFTAVAISVNPLAAEDEVTENNEKSPSTETFYLGTNHGVYEMRPNTEGKLSSIGITNGGLLGKPIRVLTASENIIYAGTQSGLYRYYKTPPVDDGNDASSTQIWHKVEDTPFDTLAIQAINVPHWDDAQVYVGTQKGLYASDNAGETWNPVAPNIYGDKSIVSIISAADNGHRVTYVASRQMDVETPLEQEESQTTAAEMDVVPSEQLEQTDTTSTARKTETETASQQMNASPIKTTVHWYLEGSSLGWEKLTETEKVVYALAGGDETTGDTNGTPIELYANTPDGLHEWNRHDWIKTERTPLISGTPAIPLLASVPSGVYVGNSTAIWHRPTAISRWRPFTTYREGISHAYEDQPIVEQAKSYLTERIPTIAQTGGEVVKEGFQFASSIAFGFGGFLATLSLTLIVFVYANQSFDNYFRSFLTLVPETHRDAAKAYLREIDKNLQEFLRGLVTVITIVSIISSIAYSVIGVPFALVIGILAGICNAIPTFGPFIGGAFAFVAMLMGLAAGDFGNIDFLVRCAFVLGAILGIQAIDNSLISPKIMSDAIDVDPLLIMFAVIVGAAVLGFWGVLLAIPTIVVIKSVITVSGDRTTLGKPT